MASITLINTQLIHQFVSRYADAVTEFESWHYAGSHMSPVHAGLDSQAEPGVVFSVYGPGHCLNLNIQTRNSHFRPSTDSRGTRTAGPPDLWPVVVSYRGRRSWSRACLRSSPSAGRCGLQEISAEKSLPTVLDKQAPAFRSLIVSSGTYLGPVFFTPKQVSGAELSCTCKRCSEYRPQPHEKIGDARREYLFYP